MMRKFLGGVLAASVALTIAPAVGAAEEFASAKEAEAMVGKAVARIKAVGKDSAYSEFTEKKPGWVDRDLYVFVVEFSGKPVAHGANAKLVGKDLIDLQDADGKRFIAEMIDNAKAKGKGWVDYKWTDPVSKKVLAKSAYCEKVEQTAVCAGVYKR